LGDHVAYVRVGVAILRIKGVYILWQPWCPSFCLAEIGCDYLVWFLFVCLFVCLKLTDAAVDQEVTRVLCAGNVVGHHFVDEFLHRG
jgi:hypothetical protein